VPAGRRDVIGSWRVYVTGDPTLVAAPSESEIAAVLEALADPRWAFRTVDGLVRATSLSEAKVRQILKNRSADVRKPLVPDARGRELWTLRWRPPSWRERYAALKDRIATW